MSKLMRPMEKIPKKHDSPTAEVSAENESSRKLKLRLPQSLWLDDSFEQVLIKLVAQDLSLSWMEVLRKHESGHVKELFDKIFQGSLQNSLIVSRRSNGRWSRSWALQNKISEFINSFEKAPKSYVVSLRVLKEDSELMPPPPRRVSTSPQPGPLRVTGRSSPVPGPSQAQTSCTFPSKKRRQGKVSRKSANRPGSVLFPHLNVPIDHDDANSMATTVASESSLRHLADQHIPHKKVKLEIIQKFVRNADNTTFLKIRNEIKTMMDGEMWMRKTYDMPTTANFLQLVFGSSP